MDSAHRLLSQISVDWILLLCLLVSPHRENLAKTTNTILQLSVLAVSLGRLVAIVQAGNTFDVDFTCMYSPRSSQVSGSIKVVEVPETITIAHCLFLGKFIFYAKWAIAEGSISIVSICLPNMAQLLQRGRQHGMSSLFTRRQYAPKSFDPSSQDNGAFQRIGYGGSASVTEGRLMSDQGGLYSVSATADQHSEERDIALGQVRMRQEVTVGGDERWAAV